LLITNIEQWLPLLWRPALDILPTSYSTSAAILEQDDYRYQFKRRLGHDYTEALTSTGAETVNIPKGKSRELYLLFTSQESIFAFFIPSADSTYA
jgi:hypothetical protein